MGWTIFSMEFWRRNPTRVTSEEYRSRLERKRPLRMWPTVRVLG